MRRGASGAIGWLRQRFSGDSSGKSGELAPELPGRAAGMNAAEAAAATEAVICETAGGGGGDGTAGRERSVAEASGLAMAGVRTTAFVDASALGEARGALCTAARRRLPLIVHATVAGAADPANARGAWQGHAAYHAVADCGAFLAFAGNAQQAADLTLLARRLAEVALVPGVVALEAGMEEELLLLPEAELVRRYLGAADDELSSPTAAQAMLFGERRRTLPRFFDLDRPAALGLGAEGRDLAAALAGQQLFFADSVAPLARVAMAELEALTGRRLSFLSDHHLQGARRVLLAQGAATGIAARLARDNVDVGVLGLDWLRPLPAEALRAALAEAETVTVLEAAGDQLAGIPPLLREIGAALGHGGAAGGPRLTSALYRTPLEAADLEALLAGDARARVRLGVTAPSAEAGAHPRRQALIQRLRREYPSTYPPPPGGSKEETLAAAPPENGGSEPELPAAVRRLARTGATWDNVARFWGELIQPGGATTSDSALDLAPDPYLALGAVPAATATFFDHTAERVEVPVIDPGACTGCGKCWTFCPDSAVAAVAIDTATLLNAAADRVEGAGESTAGESTAGENTAGENTAGEAVPKKLRRAFKQLVPRIDGRLASSGARTLTGELLDESFEWLLGKMKLDGEERAAFRRAHQRIAAEILDLPLAATDAFFVQAHEAEKGSGELLMLAVNPQACQGCGICAAVCAEEAIAIEPQTPEAVARMRSLQRVWEQLPDTAGRSIARAAELPEVGALPAILLSRHCLLSASGGDGAEPGSGQRLGVRQVTAIAEYHMERRYLALAEKLQELAEDLRRAVHEKLSGALPAGDLDALDQALDAAPQYAGNLGAIVARLEEEPGEHPGVDTPAVRGLIRSVKGVEALRGQILEGASGTGRARFGLVVAGSIARWAARFPRNPFSVPLAADPDGDGSQLATGVARALLEEHLRETRVVRRAEARLAARSDLPEREAAIDALTIEGLTPEETRLAPPVLLFTDRLAGGAPAPAVKVVVLDDRALPGVAEPVLSALAHRRALVLASSVARPEHLFDGVTAALDFPGPALVRMYAPSPRRHGFPAAETVERARLAVDCRVRPLASYDPRRDGVFGRRLDLAGNPALDQTWAEDEAGALTPERWLAGEERFAELVDPGGVAREVRETWATLQELAGVVTPFTEQLRAGIEEENRQAHQAEIEALRAEYEARIARLEADQRGTQAAVLRDRLMQLAGYGGQSVGES